VVDGLPGLAALSLVDLDSLGSRAMNDAPGQSLLEELDARQDELLIELDRLNARLERVIAECSAWRGMEEKTAKLSAAA
jgi:hypothetical protein